MMVARSNLKDLDHKMDLSNGRIELDGYGKRKHPTRYMVKLPGINRWRRVYSCCVSNSGTCYVEVKNGWHVIS